MYNPAPLSAPSAVAVACCLASGTGLLRPGGGTLSVHQSCVCEYTEGPVQDGTVSVLSSLFTHSMDSEGRELYASSWCPGSTVYLLAV